MSDWQPIETAPRDGTNILLFGVDRHAIVYEPDESVIQIGYWDTFRVAGWRLELWSPDEYTIWFCPTHWMPLPGPPK